MLSEAKHLPVKISFLAGPSVTARPERRVTFLGYTTLGWDQLRLLCASSPARGLFQK
jgi:hypothetical protein